jgi:hypothetical protein
MVEPFIRVSPT